MTCLKQEARAGDALKDHSASGCLDTQWETAEAGGESGDRAGLPFSVSDGTLLFSVHTEKHYSSAFEKNKTFGVRKCQEM